MSFLVENSYPFAWHAVQTDTVPEPDAMQPLVFALLECAGEPRAALDQSEEKASDIERLEQKINLVIFMLNNLLQSTHARPESQRLRLAADSIAWQNATPFPAGQLLSIELYLHPMITLPLRCYARTTTHAQGWTTASLAGLSEEGMSAWSKWVFRQHRQQVAQVREQGQRQSG